MDSAPWRDGESWRESPLLVRRHRVVRRWERRRIRRRLGCPLAVVPLAVTTGVVSVVWVALP